MKLTPGTAWGERPRDLSRRVRAGVVGDHDPPRVRKLGRQEVVQPRHRVGQHALLVEHRDHDLDVEATGCWLWRWLAHLNSHCRAHPTPRVLGSGYVKAVRAM